MSKIKAITVDALGIGFAAGSLGLLLLGVGFDTVGVVLFAIGVIAGAIGVVGIFVAGVVSVVSAD